MTRITVEASDVLLVLAKASTAYHLNDAESAARERLLEAAHAAAAATGEEEQQ